MAHHQKNFKRSFRSSEVGAGLLPTSPWAPSPLNWRAAVVLLMSSLCSGKAEGVVVLGGEKLAVDSFADNIAAQMDPIRRAALYLRPWPYLAGRIWGGLQPKKGGGFGRTASLPDGVCTPLDGPARPQPSHPALGFFLSFPLELIGSLSG